MVAFCIIVVIPYINKAQQKSNVYSMIRDERILKENLVLYSEKTNENFLINENENSENNMSTIYTSLQKTLTYCNDNEENLYRIDINKLKGFPNKSLNFGYKRNDKDFYVYSTKTGNVYYYGKMINGNKKIYHSELNPLLEKTSLVEKIKSFDFNKKI